MSGRRRVIVVGAGPAGLAAAARLAQRGEGAVDITLLAPGLRATFLAGTLDVALDGVAPAQFSTEVSPAGVDVVDLEARHVAADGVWAGGELLAADAVIAAPGLAVRGDDRLPGWSRATWAWDPVRARAGRATLGRRDRTRLVVAACGVPYRCPPAPFALAIGIADRRSRAGLGAEVTALSPEPVPLAGVGGGAPGLVEDACRLAGVRIEPGFVVDLGRSTDGTLRSVDGRELVYDGAWLIPPHERAACLAELPGDGPLVTVDQRGRVGTGPLYVVGDAAATGLPRAAGVARAAALVAADAVLEGLGICAAPPPEPIRASCFMFHAGGLASRIRVEYSDRGATVEIDGPSEELVSARLEERRRFLAAATGSD